MSPLRRAARWARDNAGPLGYQDTAPALDVLADRAERGELVSHLEDEPTQRGDLERHADHAFEHDARIGIDHIVALGLGQGFNQLFGRIRAGVDELHQFLQKRALVFAFRRARRMWF